MPTAGPRRAVRRGSAPADPSASMIITRHRTLLPLLAVAALALLAALAVFAAPASGGGGPAPSAAARSVRALRPLDRRADRRACRPQSRAHAGQRRACYASLGDAYLQKVRETGDPSLLRARRRRPAARAARSTPRTPDALTARGTLALARHDFRGGLRYGQARPPARRPTSSAPLRRDRRRAGRARPLRRGRARRCSGWSTSSRRSPPTRASPTSASCTATSPGALTRCALAVSAGGDAPENVAYVQTLLGEPRARARPTWRGASGRTGRARRVPGYAPAEAGLARVDAARGRLPRPIRAPARAWSRACRCPSTSSRSARPSWPPGAAGAARRDLALVRRRAAAAAPPTASTPTSSWRCSRPTTGRRRARSRSRARAWAAAPSVRSADALGWALTRGRPAARGAALGAARAARSARATRCSSTTPGMRPRGAGERGARAAPGSRARAAPATRASRRCYAPRARRALEALR